MNYFENGRNKDKLELQLTKATIEKTRRVFPDFILENKWPYEIFDHEIKIPKTYSHSTNAMILFSLIAASGKTGENCPLIPDVDLIEPYDFQAETQKYEEVWKELLTQIEKELEKKKQITYSSTFGKNDILTLSWLIEIERSKVFETKIQAHITKKINESIQDKKLLKIDPIKIEDGSSWLEWDEGKERRSIDHAFLALRCIQLRQSFDLKPNPEKKSSDNHDSKHLSPFIDYFDNRIHEQLSKFEIRDGDFDAAELIFALEGLLLTKPLSISRAKLNRIFYVITESQNKNPYWRPVKPIVVTPQGRVLFPLSVETASSLLRCCNLIENECNEPNYFSKNLDLFRRYVEWLRSRIITGWAKPAQTNGENAKDRIKFHGWHSEHVHMHPGIHIWETANVFLFLHYYSFMLEKHIANKSLEAAGLSAQFPENSERDMVEPLSPKDCNEKLRPYSYAENHLIGPRRQNQNSEEKTYSILLYGPPGTGKTNFAEYICQKLNWPLITITPSDIIQGGESEVEARAKKIFEVLEDQFDAVILLDEIDRMILDRSSKGYNKQGDFFQFMTPGMLTKLRNLRKKERCIFIIATNYRERIDPAAIRKGRIDDHLLMSAPDKNARSSIVKQLLCKRLNLRECDESAFENIAKKTSLYIYSELKGLIDDAAVKSSSKNILETLDADLNGRANSDNISLSSYKNRFEGDDEYPQKPYVEFLVLLYIKLEANQQLEAIERKLAQIVFQKLLDVENEKYPDKKAVETKLRRKFPELSPFVDTIMKEILIK
ncbi:MAG: ATP-binding protein [Desulfotignum sp.]|nr:ATP-binding protein [Desulfotignum sp.]MCF8136332.1 ATP-binding protein [Desulfotignum sp.]